MHSLLSVLHETLSTKAIEQQPALRREHARNQLGNRLRVNAVERADLEVRFGALQVLQRGHRMNAVERRVGSPSGSPGTRFNGATA